MNYIEQATAPDAATAPVVKVDVTAEIHEHLNDMEKAIADFGSAGGSVLSELIALIRSKL